jgi:hypothetical protein
LDYRWIQKSITRNVTSKSLKKARDQLSHINRSYTFFPTTCVAIKDVNLDWDDFEKNYKLLYSTIEIFEHVIAKFPDLLHFLDFWVVYREENGILPLMRPKRIPPGC